MIAKFAAVALLLGIPVVAPNPAYFRYQRPIHQLPVQGGPSCAVLDPVVFAHAAQGLSDLRLYDAGKEIPYGLRGSDARTGITSLAVELLNKGESKGHTSFDAEMPRSSYDDVELMVNAKDFIAAVSVWGSQEKAGARTTKLGEFTIFDLSRQRLGRSTVLHLPPSNFMYLHFEIAGPLHPEELTSAQLLWSQQEKPRFVTVAATSAIHREGKRSVVSFTLPAHVPVDRVTVTPEAEPAQFSRTATVEVAQATPPKAGETPAPAVVRTGQLIRVHSVQNGARIDREELTLDAPYSEDNVSRRWTVHVDNGDDQPLAIREVRLEMVERRICFAATAGMQAMLVYGDPPLTAPSYDYSRVFAEDKAATMVLLGAEQANPAWKPRPDERAFTEKHPALLWMALVAAVLVLGLIALRSLPTARNTPE